MSVRNETVGFLKNRGKFGGYFDQRKVFVKMFNEVVTVDSALAIHANQTVEERIDSDSQSRKIVRGVMNNGIFVGYWPVLRADDQWQFKGRTGRRGNPMRWGRTGRGVIQRLGRT